MERKERGRNPALSDGGPQTGWSIHSGTVYPGAFHQRSTFRMGMEVPPTFEGGKEIREDCQSKLLEAQRIPKKLLGV